jgi:hypothetical protein
MAEFFKNPLSELSIFLYLILATLFSLFETAGLFHAFSMAEIGMKANLPSMIGHGLSAVKKTLDPRNWLIILYLIVLMPLTGMLIVSTSGYKVAVPYFLIEGLEKDAVQKLESLRPILRRQARQRRLFGKLYSKCLPLFSVTNPFPRRATLQFQEPASVSPCKLLKKRRLADTPPSTTGHNGTYRLFQQLFKKIDIITAAIEHLETPFRQNHHDYSIFCRSKQG